MCIVYNVYTSVYLVYLDVIALYILASNNISIAHTHVYTRPFTVKFTTTKFAMLELANCKAYESTQQLISKSLSKCLH